MLKSKIFLSVLILLIASLGLLFLHNVGGGAYCANNKISEQKPNDCSDPCSETEPCKESVMDKARAKLMSSFYCSTYSACSVDKDLCGASEAELEEYNKAKTLDGKTFTDRISPDFQAVSTKGETVSLSQFRGKPVALIFLAVHCNHSQDTLPIISSLKKEYEPKGLSILPVYVHSGSVEDVKQFAEAMKLDFPLLVVSKQVSNKYETRMVPTMFLIDSAGHIVRQFVGFKKQPILVDAFTKLIAVPQTAEATCFSVASGVRFFGASHFSDDDIYNCKHNKKQSY